MSGATYHVPVLLEPCVRFLAEAPPGPWVDGTRGGGGHTAAMLAAAGGTRPILSIDQDPDALAACASRFEADPHRSTLTIAKGNFRDIKALVAEHLGEGACVAGLLLDLGVSSHQLDAPERGFGLRHGGSGLDMRMSQDPAMPSARDFVRDSEPEELAKVLRDFGEIPSALTMARRLQDAAARGRLETAADLMAVADSMRAAFRRLHVHPATLVAQALRIAINDEMGALDAVLRDAPDILRPGGRLVVMSYHSLEDRRVKQAFLRGAHGPERPARLPPPSDWRPSWQILTSKPVAPSAEEIAANPRARSARLRVAARHPDHTPAGGRP